MKTNNIQSLLAIAVVVAGGVVLWGCDTASIQPLEESDAREDVSLKNGDIIPGQFIVVIDDSRAGKAPELVVDDLLRERKAELIHRYGTALHGFAAKMTNEEADDLERDVRVKYVEPDRFVSLGLCDANPTHPKCDPNGGGGDPPDDTQVVPWGVTRVGGGSAYAGSGVAWVLDTGIDLDHPDLNVDAARGTTVFSNRKDGNLDDGHGHGSHVAGTIGAIGNSIGVVGVAAGATVIPVKVLNSRGSGSYSGIIEGIEWVGLHGEAGDVANMSLGGGFSQAVNDAVFAASVNVKFVLAAGNESTHAGTRSPASTEGNNVYTISAIDSQDRFASFSNYGNPPVDYAAPGVGVKSTYKKGGYTTFNGTSMAAPHVAGILLLGQVHTDKNASGDPDGNPDPIAHL